MKFLTLALFLGTIQADQIHDAINALKISVSKGGQKKIEKQANDVEEVIDKIKDSKPVNRLEHSLKKWAHTKEVNHIKKIDEKFMKSPLGKKMVKEWTDVGKVLEENLTETTEGVHFPNEKMDELSKEADDVADTYDKFFKSKWAKAYDEGWHAALHNKEAAGVKKAAKAFKHSKEGQALKKEMKELKWAIKKNVKVEDIPEDWKHNADLLKIEVTEEGAAAIEKEFNDVERTAKKIKHTKPVKSVKRNLRRWAHTDEVQAIKELDQKFLKSKEGQELMQEWKEFGEALKTHVKETPNGIHIDNEGVKIIENEADDVAAEYKQLEHSRWAKKYDAAWKKALETKEAEKLGHSLDRFGKSKEWHALEKELKELDYSLQKHVKVSDMPEHWDDTEALLKISVDKEGAHAIEKEVDDIEMTWDKIEDSKPVQNVGHSLEKLGSTEEAKYLKELDERFAASKEGQELEDEIKDFFDALDEHVTETENGIHIDNEAVKIIEGEAEDIEHEWNQFEKSHWAKEYDAAFKDLGNT